MALPIRGLAAAGARGVRTAQRRGRRRGADTGLVAIRSEKRVEVAAAAAEAAAAFAVARATRSARRPEAPFSLQEAKVPALPVVAGSCRAGDPRQC